MGGKGGRARLGLDWGGPGRERTGALLPIVNGDL